MVAPAGSLQNNRVEVNLRTTHAEKLLNAPEHGCVLESVWSYCGASNGLPAL